MYCSGELATRREQTKLIILLSFRYCIVLLVLIFYPSYLHVHGVSMVAEMKS